MTDIDPLVPEVVASFPSEIEASTLVAALEEAGIKAMAIGEHVSGFRIEIPGQVQVVVKLEDLPRAQALYNEIQNHSDPVNWAEVDTGDPTTESPSE